MAVPFVLLHIIRNGPIKGFVIDHIDSLPYDVVFNALFDPKGGDLRYKYVWVFLSDLIFSSYLLYLIFIASLESQEVFFSVSNFFFQILSVSYD